MGMLKNGVGKTGVPAAKSGQNARGKSTGTKIAPASGRGKPSVQTGVPRKGIGLTGNG